MNCFKSLILLSFAVFVLNFAGTAQTKQTGAQTAVRAVLDEQVTAWNRGDIAGFMRGYDNSPDTTFSGKTFTRGWQTVFDNYKKNYDSPAKMGVLTFDELEINLLSKNSAFVTGRWNLKREGDNPNGRFTLIFRKVKDGWRIVHDHTS